MRNPNGYGSVFKLSGNRRKPFAVRITQGYTDEGKQIYEYLSYHTTRKEAMQVLASYNANPYDIELNNITFSELYDKWSDRHFKDLSKNSIKTYVSSYNHCKPIYNIKMKDIKIFHLQKLIDNLNKNHSSLQLIKSLIGLVFRYAMELDIIQKDYSKFMKVGKHTVIKEKSVFTDDEIDTLWKNVDSFRYTDTILMMIYTGMRVGELLNLKKEDVDLLEQTVTVKESKTAAGQNRVIPIHSRIKDLIHTRYETSNSEYLISNIRNTKAFNYNNYKIKIFDEIMKTLNMDHTPHDCRHTFATRLNDAGGNATAIKKMIGHESFTMTEKIYTHKKVAELKKTIELVN